MMMNLIESSFPCNYCGQASEVEHDCIDVLNARIRSLEHDHRLMREALEKYSDNGHWQSDGLWCDHGETARTALDKLEVKDE